LHERVRLPVRSVPTRVRAHPPLVPYQAGRSPPHTHLRAAPLPPYAPESAAPPFIRTRVPHPPHPPTPHSSRPLSPSSAELSFVFQYLITPVIFFHIQLGDMTGCLRKSLFLVTLSLGLFFYFFSPFFRFFFKFNKVKSMIC
jgi:hypothetical protein